MATSSKTPSPSHPIYSLEPLLQDSSEIRLLYLHPRGISNEIRCTIKTAKFTYERSDDSDIRVDHEDQVSEIPRDERKYEALSYAWGPEPKSKTAQRSIAIDGNRFPVSENLWLALFHLRFESTRVLWIDAICIDQGNLSERNQQVAMMGLIYSRASMVIVWLGSSDAASVLAFDGLKSNGWAGLLSDDPSTIMEGNKKLKSLDPILHREYWKRLWIIQEFLMAKDFIIQCGNEICPGFRITWFMTWIGSINPVVPETMVIIQKIRGSVLARLVHQREERNPTRAGKSGTIKDRPHLSHLFRLYQEHHETECYETQDKVFGLHSLGSACCREAVPINYGLSLETILGKLIYHELYCHRSLPKRLVATSSNSVIQKFRDFYLELAARTPSSDGAFESFANDFPKSSLDSANRIYQLNAYVRGRVCYLDRGLKNCQRPSNLSPMVKLQLKHILDRKGSWQTRKSRPQNDLDLVSLITNSKTSLDRTNAWVGKPIPYSKRQSQRPFRHQRSMITQIFNEVVNTEYNRQNCQIAFEENGLVFFTSRDTKLGDLVCQFPQSDVLAVIFFEKKTPNPGTFQYRELSIFSPARLQRQ